MYANITDLTQKFHLTPRETTAVQGVADGLSAKEFAAKETSEGRPISNRRVENLLRDARIRNKMTTHQLVLHAYDYKLISKREVYQSDLIAELQYADQRPLSGAQIATPALDDLWLPSELSDPIIRREPVQEDGRQCELEEVLRKYYPDYIGHSYSIDVVAERWGTFDFRVENEKKKAILLREYTRMASGETLHAIQARTHHMSQSSVFSDPPLRDCLEPLLTRSGKKYVVHNERYFEAYIFAEGVKYYSGKNLDQIKNVAQKLGATQRELETIHSSIPFRSTSFPASLVWFGAKPGQEAQMRLRDMFKLIRANNNYAVEWAPNVLVNTFHQNQEFLEETWNEIERVVARIMPPPKPLLHQMHPHYAYFQDDECVLIHNYETVMQSWPHWMCLAFAIQRFVREYIRIHEAPGQVRGLVDMFLENYGQGYGMTIPPRFRNFLHLGIKITNFCKLLHIMADNFRVGQSLREPNDNTKYAELVKLIGSIKEAEHFDSRTW